MKVSVIIPIYNAEKYLKLCLDSLVKQSFQDFEVIMINDGSNDKSGDICYEYKIKDHRFKTINKNNSGVSSARNDGIYAAKGDWITFIDNKNKSREQGPGSKPLWRLPKQGEASFRDTMLGQPKSSPFQRPPTGSAQQHRNSIKIGNDPSCPKFLQPMI